VKSASLRAPEVRSFTSGHELGASVPPKNWIALWFAGIARELDGYADNNIAAQVDHGRTHEGWS
jgi:hypothetical protein